MRRAMLLSILVVFVFSIKTEAQHFHYVNSIGVQHHWDLPHSVYDEIGYHYHGYDIVHVGNVWRNGFNYFDVTLQRGNVFVRLEMGNRGRILSKRMARSFPFQNHVCNNHCGFHNDFFRVNRAVCSTPYYNRHVNRPTSVVYVQPTYYGQGNHWKGKAGGKVKGKGRVKKQQELHRNSNRPSTNSRTGLPNSRSRASQVVGESAQPTYRSRSSSN